MNPILRDLLPPHMMRFIEAAWASRVRLVAFVGGVAIVAAIIALLLPQWYRAQATLLPPAEGSDAFGIMAGMIQTSALNKLGFLSTATPSDVFAEILRSRSLQEELIRKFDLERRYQVKNLDFALMALKGHIAIEVSKAGLIMLEVEDRDPRRASDMANYMVFMLDRFNREVFVTKAKRTREFLEQRLVDVRGRLQSAESTLTAYERTNKVIASGESSAIEGVAEVIAQRLNLQVRRSYVSSFSSPNSPELRAMDAEMAAFDRELAKLPGLRQEGARLALEAEIQRKVFALLTAQYEDARVQEMRDTPTITVLDSARPPAIRARPRRGVMVLAASGLAIVMSLTWVAFSIREPRRP